jgi:Uma2 family endonuclease
MATVSSVSPMTLDSDSIDLLDVGPDGNYEVFYGKVEEKPAMGVYETHIASSLFYPLDHFVRSKQVGRVEAEMLFLLDRNEDVKYRPDLACVLFERWPRDRPIPREEAWNVVPDLAIEVISSRNLATKVVIKIRDYFRHGVRSVWLLYPVEELVYVYDSPTIVRGLTRHDTLESQDILPGFQLPLSQLFEATGTAG